MGRTDANAIHCTKHQNKPTSEKNHEEYPNKFHHNFLFKVAIVAIFLVILSLLPSQAPEIINQSLLTRSWELLHLLLVGIAISYGLFSSRNNETDKGKENNMSKFDNAQILVSRLLNVSSVFYDEEADAENSSSESDHRSTKVQTWNNQHYRNEPVIVVAPHEDQGSGDGAATASASTRSRIGEKPLLLPVRSLKSRLSDDGEIQRPKPQLKLQFNDAKVDNNESSSVSSFSLNRSNSKTGSRQFSRNSNNSRNDELEGAGDAKVENKMNDNVVLPSPIPWRTRSGRLEPKLKVEAPSQHASRPSLEEFEFSKMVPGIMKSETSFSSQTNPLPSSPKFTPSPSFLPEYVKESLAKNKDDFVRKKGFYNKSCPPPPPPPPPPMFRKSISMKPRHGSFNERANYSSFDKELKRSFTSETNGMKMNRFESSIEVKPKGYAENMSNIGKSVRKIKADQNKSLLGKEGTEEKEELEDEEHYMQEPTRKGMGYDSMEFGEQEQKESFLDKVVMESYDEYTETEDEDVGAKIIQKESVESSKTDETNSSGIGGDEGQDVDKKADEFIAKFREQIRLQRIEFIKRSTTKITRNSTR
ncbi:unnamed protein product [Lupinus luteus]|uniref:Hydroxyproline-rich glycoprotein family protein n=1 Tax=Lupinus luteus TaxID=3873 RepID=A0AAV1WWN5_LUPLU